MDAQPVPAIDVMQKELWSLPMAAAWMIWRIEDAVHDARPHTIDSAGELANNDIFRHTVGFDLADIFKLACNPDLKPRIGGSDAPEKFWSAMLSARLHPTGVPVGGSVRISIPPEEWREFTFYHPPQGRHRDAIGTNEKTRYADVRVPREEVMAAWPEHEKEQAPVGPAQATQQTNAEASVAYETERNIAAILAKADALSAKLDALADATLPGFPPNSAKQTANQKPKKARGPKRKVSKKDVIDIVTDVFKRRGPFDQRKPGWNNKQRLLEHVETELESKINSRSTIESYVEEALSFLGYDERGVKAPLQSR